MVVMHRGHEGLVGPGVIGKLEMTRAMEAVVIFGVSSPDHFHLK